MPKTKERQRKALMKSTKTQDATLEAIKAMIDDSVARSGESITVECGRFTATGVTGVDNAPTHAKADWVLTCEDSGSQLYITHKAEGFSHNGYGSVGTKAFASKSRYRSPKIWAFAKWARAYCIEHQETEISNGIMHWRGNGYRGVWCVPPKELQALIVFGPEYQVRNPRYGLFNCHVSAIGDPELTQIDGASRYRLTFKRGLHSNGEIPDGDDEPILCIGSRIGQQMHTYLTANVGGSVEGFAGWVGVFPSRILNGQSPKGARLEPIPWPGAKLLDFMPQ
jgi:hypothetical protein